MTAHEEVETTLERLGRAWPQDDSLANRVLHGLETAPRITTGNTARSRWVRIAVCAAAIAAAAVLGLTIRTDDSLFAQARDAVRRARTFQMVMSTPAQGDKPAELFRGYWYERGVGFREESPTEIRVGNVNGNWRYLKATRMAVQSGENIVSETVDNLLNDDRVGRLLENEKHAQRYAAGDQIVNGRPCEAYLLASDAPKVTPAFKDGKRRLVALLDDQARIVRVLIETGTADDWAVEFVQDWTYDATIDPALFEPKFGDDVRVVDVDAAFDEFVNLEKAVYKEERQGLIFAIHHIERFENGAVYLVSSVRGTEETSRKYPLTRYPWPNLGTVRVVGPAKNCNVGQDYKFGGCDLELASMEHAGIHVRWRALIPFQAATEDRLAIGPGQVKIPVGVTPYGEYGKANFMDQNGVIHHLEWDIVVDVAAPTAATSFDSIALQVYSDCTVLEAVPFKYLNMGNRGLHPFHRSDLSEVSEADYRAAVADDLRWWKEGCPMDDPRRVYLSGPSVRGP